MLVSPRLWTLALSVVGVSGSPIVQTRNGPVRGFDREAQGQTVSSFQGLPFAIPPVGELRFRHPVPINRTWPEPLNATRPPPICLQANRLNKQLKGSEDCLYLSIYTPRKALASQQLLPVMLFIHGGGFKEGDEMGPDSNLYDGANLTGRHDVVVVTIQYRLGALGFSTFVHGMANAGMADQRLAMQWTFNNIKHFGGDPHRTTIFGESAGGMSVVYHLVSPPSWPFFGRAIAESGPARLPWLYQPLDEARARTFFFQTGARRKMLRLVQG